MLGHTMSAMVNNSQAAPVTPPGSPHKTQLSGLDRWFEITQRGSDVGREVRGGLVTFFTMAYIIALNPIIIGSEADSTGRLISGAPKYLDAARTQVDWAAVADSKMMVAAGTALIAGLMTILMGVWGRYPLGLATGLGLNAMLAYAIAPQMTWAQAMGLVVWEGILITLLVMTGIRTAVFRAVPPPMRTAISVGIGLFVTFVGLMDAGVVRKPAGSTPVELGINGSLMGWPIAVCITGFLLLVILYTRKVRGAMLLSILLTSVLAVVVEAVFKVGPTFLADGSKKATGWALNVPKLPSAADFASPSLGTLGKVDMLGAFSPEGHFSFKVFLGLLLLVFSLLLADFFDTVGTVVAIGQEGDLLNDKGNPPHLQQILTVDSVAAMAGGLGGVSSNTSYIESAAGVGEGARTGLASVVTGIAFLLSIFLTPIVDMIPSEAAAPVLAFVGYLMMSQVAHVDWDDVEDGIPAFLTIVLMPFAYSITTGIGAGFIVYCLIKLIKGKAKQVHPLLWAVSALFVVYFAQGILMSLVDKI
ncbi:AGZA family xanthine/uracil permease-like MFS transporter [Luteococcus japonicus]|uniref:AGZA family xanthine/uracil permease-like MFS transporter n=2 Tax=Luteococcus japonicus TaxID=33984 RepID=A0A3N1ZTQ5_9ACTN|nr:AGZA family xanthine/uracil permease-like MFS transporter [Luteococcus japonicus]